MAGRDPMVDVAGVLPRLRLTEASTALACPSTSMVAADACNASASAAAWLSRAAAS